MLRRMYGLVKQHGYVCDCSSRDKYHLMIATGHKRDNLAAQISSTSDWILQGQKEEAYSQDSLYHTPGFLTAKR